MTKVRRSWNSTLRPQSAKGKVRQTNWKVLEGELRIQCQNRSELDGSRPRWPNFNVEGHHIKGRTGSLLLNPLNVIMLTRIQHDQIVYRDKDELLELVKGIRLKQGYKEEWDGFTF